MHFLDIKREQYFAHIVKEDLPLFFVHSHQAKVAH